MIFLKIMETTTEKDRLLYFGVKAVIVGILTTLL